MPPGLELLQFSVLEGLGLWALGLLLGAFEEAAKLRIALYLLILVLLGEATTALRQVCCLHVEAEGMDQGPGAQ